MQITRCDFMFEQGKPYLVEANVIAAGMMAFGDKIAAIHQS